MPEGKWEMMYSQIVNMPTAGLFPCKEQHDAYKLEKAAHDELAAQLGPAAAACNKLHSDYNDAEAARVAMIASNEKCVAEIAVWSKKKAAYDAYLAYKKDCDKYISLVRSHVKYVAKTKAANASLKRGWEAKVEELTKKNIALSSDYRGKSSSYSRALSAWKEKNGKYQQYKSASAAMAAGYSRGFYMKMKGPSASQGYKNLYDRHNWRYRTLRCGSMMQCMTREKKAQLTTQCVVIRGTDGLGAIGSTSKTDAPICTTRLVYPTCPETSSCPAWAPGPGSAPVAPKKPAYHKMPSEPKYGKIPTLKEWLIKHGGKDMRGCDNKPKVPNPGTKPGCNPTGTIPFVPKKPTCVPPEIPAAPIKPTCKPNFLSQVGPMWLILAAGAGGLYLYNKKK